MRRIITPSDGGWPSQLNDLGSGRPKKLHIEGDDLPEKEKCIAIVGTRLASAAGLSLARTFAMRFVQAGYVVVSGMARGVDTAAHRGALEAGGRTIAVMGCGLDIAYPARNTRLKSEIAHRGTTISEYEDDAPPNAFHFPQRNRIIAALGRGTVVIEGGLKSGALITARDALDLGRDVYAVPGAPGDPRSEGPNLLIRSGEAALVTHPDQLFEDIAPQIAWDTGYLPGAKSHALPGPEELEVLRALSTVPCTADEIVLTVDLPPGRVALALSKLEVRGLATSTRGGAYLLSETGARTLHYVSQHPAGAGEAGGQVGHVP